MIADNTNKILQGRRAIIEVHERGMGKDGSLEWGESESSRWSRCRGAWGHGIRKYSVGSSRLVGWWSLPPASWTRSGKGETDSSWALARGLGMDEFVLLVFMIGRSGGFARSTSELRVVRSSLA